MAEARERNTGLPLHGPAEHDHRVGIVEHHRVGAVALHILGNTEHHRNGAQRTEDAGRAARVANVGVNPILLGDLNVVAPDIQPAGQNGDDHIVGPLQRRRAILGRRDGGGIVAHPHNLFNRLVDKF